MAEASSLFVAHGAEIRWLLGLGCTTAIIVWRIAVLQTLLQTQNGRIGKLETNVMYRDTCHALHAQTADMVQRVETDIREIRQQQGGGAG